MKQKWLSTTCGCAEMVWTDGVKFMGFTTLGRKCTFPSQILFSLENENVDFVP